MKKKLFALLLLNLLPVIAFSQKTPNANYGIQYITIYLSTGDSIKAQSGDTAFTAETSKIKIKGDGKQTISVQDIDRISYKTTSNSTIDYYVFPVFKDGSDKLRSKKAIVLQSYKGKKITLYTIYSEFMLCVYYYCKREDEKALTLLNTKFAKGGGLAIPIGFDRYFKKFCPIYFADNPTIVNKIKNGQYTSDNFMEIVQEYDAAP